MTIEDLQRLVAADHGLATVSVARDDGSVHSSVVNVGVLEHPVEGDPTVAMVVRANAVKLARWRVEPSATVVVRAGWSWVGVQGRVTLCGPADPMAGVGGNRLADLLRRIFVAAGGTHDDWAEYDRVMAAEGRTAVFVSLDRLFGNP